MKYNRTNLKKLYSMKKSNHITYEILLAKSLSGQGEVHKSIFLSVRKHYCIK